MEEVDMVFSKSRRWLTAWLIVLTVAGATVFVSASAGFAEACNSPFRSTDLSLSGSAEPAGPNMNYTNVVTNNGPDCTSGVTLTAELAPGSTFVGLVRSDPGNWSCSGSAVVTCTLQSTLPSPPGNNVAFVTFAATKPSSPDNATVHGTVSSVAEDNALTNNEVWVAFGTKNKAGSVSGSHPSVTVARSDVQSIAMNLLDTNGFPPAPPGFSFQTDRAILVETPAAPGQSKKQALVLVITFSALSKPGAFVFHLNHDTNTWEVVNQKCGGNGPFPCVDGVSFDSRTGIASITVLTQHFSHYSK
jgi:hypothetical protein